jgi:Transcription factor zinc-finger
MKQKDDLGRWDKEGKNMEGERDRFGEFMKLLERAKEDIYFAAKDQELIAKLKQRLEKVDRPDEAAELHCPKCHGLLERYTLMDFLLDRCQACGGVWFDKDEIDAIAALVGRSPLFTPMPRVP